MYISAVISEFNPFHLGHQYLIDSIRKNGTTHIVTVMSGNFVQRGEPAILSKWARTEIALNCGVDLVLEMPTIWSIATAEKYAYAGIKILDSLGCVDALYFGSECGDIDLLSKVSDVLLEEKVFNVIKKFLKQGMTYAKAREMTIGEILGGEFNSLLRKSNNILGIEYIKAVNKLNCKFSVNTIARKGAGHDSTNTNLNVENIISASSIRSLIRQNENIKKFVPNKCAQIIDREISFGNAPSDFTYTERAVLAKLRSLKINQILCLPDISEGIEFRIFNAIKKCKSIDEIYFNIKTKRYTMSRIRRIILSAFLGIDKKSQFADIPYIRVLGFNQRGKDILNIMKSKAKLPIVTNFAQVKKLDDNCIDIFERENVISDLYSLMLPKIGSCNTDKTSKIIVTN